MTQINKDQATLIFAAWIRDRAERYDNSSACRCVFDELLDAIRNGEPWAAYHHGELDELMKVRANAGQSLLRPAVVVQMPANGLPPTNYRKPRGGA